MTPEPSTGRVELLEKAVEIVSSHVSNNAVSPEELPDLIASVFSKLTTLRRGRRKPEAAELVPAVPVRRSVTEDFIIGLEDGKKLKTLKRHLMTAYNMTPEEYRAKWGLKPDYPMVRRTTPSSGELAKKIGLGRNRRIVEPAPKTTVRKPRTKRRRLSLSEEPLSVPIRSRRLGRLCDRPALASGKARVRA